MLETFKHSAPELYNRFMGPLLFEPCAKIVAERLAKLLPHRILETAAGTGILTRAINRAAPRAQIIATDINPALLEYAKTTVNSPKVEFQLADAHNLPFSAASFDLIVCQFGAMFFPDKIRANEQAHRVLREHGRYLLVTFDDLERNPIPKAAEDAVNALFPDAPITYMKSGPFCYSEPKQIESDLLAAGFTRVDIDTITLSTRVNPKDAAKGLVFGSPLLAEITKRDSSALERATEAVADALQRWQSKDAPISVHIATARKAY
jgi:ubiquinone/menaquinone biosynthesis C-methylase UbiE